MIQLVNESSDDEMEATGSQQAASKDGIKNVYMPNPNNIREGQWTN